MSSLQSNQTSKNLPTSLLLLHLLVTLVVECFLDKPFYLLTFLGSVAATIGFSIIAIVSYILLYRQKIKKIGTYVSIAIQIMSSSGYWGSVLIHYTDSYYILGILCGIVSNAFYIAAMLVLLNTQAPINPPTIQNNLASAETSVSDMSSIAFCPNCGNKIISEEHQFCGHCGNCLTKKHIEQKCPPPAAAAQESEACIQFSNAEDLDQETIKKRFEIISIPKDKKLLAIGKFEIKGFSLIPWITTVSVWVIEFLLVASSYRVEKSYISGTSYYLLNMCFASEHPTRNSSSELLYESSIGLIFLICLCLLSIPLFVMSRVKNSQRKNELALTNTDIHLTYGKEAYMIALNEIESIKRSPCLIFQSAETITITETSGETVNIRGVTNAKHFVEKSYEAYKSIKTVD